MHRLEYRKPSLLQKIYLFKKDFYNCCLKIFPTFLYPVILKLVYKKKYKRSLNLKNPRTITEKIQWIKINQNTEIKQILSDKIRAKSFISEKIPSLKIAQIYNIKHSFKEIDFQNLPNCFLIKTNHSCKNTVLIKDRDSFIKNKKLYREISGFFNKELNRNYAFQNFFEMQYEHIKPFVFIEEFLCPQDASSYREYGVWCCNGKVVFIEYLVPNINSGFIGMEKIGFDVDWNKLDCYTVWSSKLKEPKPKNYQKIIEYSIELSSQFEFVRVDYMEIDGELYFLEMTFSPSGGFLDFTYAHDLKLGSLLKL